MRILITGGAGFIGAHAANELLRKGHFVRALDSLVPQVHGPERQRPAHLNPDVELQVGDIRDSEAVSRALDGIDAVIHLVALEGAGQSMYQIAEYTSVNNLGTAQLLQAISTRPIERLVVASSMSIYGEGLYWNMQGESVTPPHRTLEQLRIGVWEMLGEDGEPLKPVATPETNHPELASVYALSKYDQEQMCAIVGRTCGIPVVSLRLFNTYGPHQALSNPYTGVLGHFATRVLNDQPPLIYEDGLQQRDFVSVYDVARACRLALESPRAAGQCFNISSGHPMTVTELATRVIKAISLTDIAPEITGKFRAGDIRHCFADITRARLTLGWEPQVSLERGLEDLAEWLTSRRVEDRALDVRSEPAVRGLTA